LQRITERVRQLPVMIIVTFRPEFDPPWTGESQVTSLRLSRLARRESTALVERVASGKNLPAEIVERVVERTDGIPLFVEELTKSLLEGGLLREEEDRYVLEGPAPSLAIPSTLQDSLMARLDRLPAVKEVAQIAAAIGREFSYNVLAAVARCPEDRLREVIDEFIASGLAHRRGAPPDETFVVKHAFVQDAAYSTLLRGRRQQLHGAIAQVFEAEFTPGDDERAALLAHHWLAAESWGKALSYTWGRPNERKVFTRDPRRSADIGKR
jgi:predicted ATPase